MQPFTPKVLRVKERTPTPCPSTIFTFRHFSLSKSLWECQYVCGNKARKNIEKSFKGMENGRHFLKVIAQTTLGSLTYTWDPIDILVALACGQDFR
jgi:hypothetical protein